MFRPESANNVPNVKTAEQNYNISRKAELLLSIYCALGWCSFVFREACLGGLKHLIRMLPGRYNLQFGGDPSVKHPAGFRQSQLSEDPQKKLVVMIS